MNDTPDAQDERCGGAVLHVYNGRVYVSGRRGYARNRDHINTQLWFFR